MKHLLILLNTITGCVSISVFALILGIPTGIASSGQKFCATTPVIKKYQSTITKKKKKT